MAKSIVIKQWWKAKEIPFAEYEWINVKKYCEDQGDPWGWKDCIYFFRLAPPFTIAYGDDDKKYSSPLVYIGSGTFKTRWQNHLKNWIDGIGHWLPGARYELWVFRHEQYKQVESDALHLFRNYYGRLPLANRSGGKTPLHFDYSDEHAIHAVAEQDRRYWWAMKPIQPDVREYFEKGLELI